MKLDLIFGSVILTCMGGGAPDPPPPAPPPPEMQDAGVIESRDNERRRRRASVSNTFLTANQSTAVAPVVGVKTLLGQ